MQVVFLSIFLHVPTSTHAPPRQVIDATIYTCTTFPMPVRRKKRNTTKSGIIFRTHERWQFILLLHRALFISIGFLPLALPFFGRTHFALTSYMWSSKMVNIFLFVVQCDTHSSLFTLKILVWYHNPLSIVRNFRIILLHAYCIIFFFCLPLLSFLWLLCSLRASFAVVYFSLFHSISYFSALIYSHKCNTPSRFFSRLVLWFFF